MRGKDGFSLLEVVFAMFIMAVAFVSLTAYSRVQRSALGKSEMISEATRLALTTLEADKTKLSRGEFFRTTMDRLEMGIADSTFSPEVRVGLHVYKVSMVRERIPGATSLIKIRARVWWDGWKHGVVLAKLVAAP